ncbi:hypothetical protein PG987_005284 [Apiospora arundinis]
MDDKRNNADFYRPLDVEKLEFRLLLLLAGDGDEPVKCQLVHASLKDEENEGATDEPGRPPYETISYCRDDTSETGTIFVDGLEMVVPLSSATVLRRMRKPLEDRTLWIDTICINQDDVEERRGQIALMDEINSKAAHEFIWSGQGDEGLDKIKDTTGFINGDPEQFADFLETSESPIRTDTLRANPFTIGFALIAEWTTAWGLPTAEFARTFVLVWAVFLLKNKERPRYVNMSFSPN